MPAHFSLAAISANRLSRSGSTANLNLKPETSAATEKSGLRAHMEIDVPQGQASLVTGVYDWTTGKPALWRFRSIHPKWSLPQSKQPLPHAVYAPGNPNISHDWLATQCG